MDCVNFFGYESLFSTRLRELIENKGVSKQTISTEIGVSRQAISQYCDGSTVPNADKLLKIADYFNVSVDYLVGKTEVPTINRDLQFICDYTGLSVDAADLLHAYSPKQYGDYEEHGSHGSLIQFVKYILDNPNKYDLPYYLDGVLDYAKLILTFCSADDVSNDVKGIYTVISDFFVKSNGVKYGLQQEFSKIIDDFSVHNYDISYETLKSMVFEWKSKYSDYLVSTVDEKYSAVDIDDLPL